MQIVWRINNGWFRLGRVRIRKLESKLYKFCQFHSSQVSHIKVFMDKENKYAHEVLEQSLKPYQIFRVNMNAKPSEHIKLNELLRFVLSPSKTNDVNTTDVLDALCDLTRYCRITKICISDDRFRPFTELLCAKCRIFTDEQLLEVLEQMVQLPEETSSKSVNYMNIWNSLDIECCRRIEHWSTDQLLLVCDAWYILNLARISDFVREALRKIGRKVHSMRPEQLVHTMFFCNLLRRPVFEIFPFELNFMRCADSMSLKELGVMSMGFFKTQTPIRNRHLLELLYKRLIAKLDSVDDITLVSILKVLRYSSTLHSLESINQLLDKLQSQVHRISLLSCLHVALFGVEIHICHNDLMKNLIHRFNVELDHLRLKDMERICLAIGVFNYHSATGIEHELCVKILTLLQSRVDEILKYPRCFTTCLHYLTLSGHYDKVMLSSVMDGKFIEHAYGKNLIMGREMLHLDSFIHINLKDDYTGNRLSDKARRTMGKVLVQYIPDRNAKFKLNITDRILIEIKETFDCMMWPNYFKHLLPHFERPDIVICYNNTTRRAVPLSVECPEAYCGMILSNLNKKNVYPRL